MSANLKLIISALQAKVKGLDLAKRQAEEMVASLMNEKLRPKEIESLFIKITQHCEQQEVTRSESYAGVIQNTLMALDQVIQTTHDADAKQRLIEITKQLHITVRA